MERTLAPSSLRRMHNITKSVAISRRACSSFWLHKASMAKPSQKFSNLFVLDFEATCDQNKKFQPNEIIEFPCVQVETSGFKAVSQFHEYVKPKVNPELTYFCTDLTGITQEMVEDVDEFPAVFERFKAWMESRTSDGRPFAMVCCGDWDFKTMLPQQCRLSGLEVPDYCQSWINVKKSYCSHYGQFPRGLKVMLGNLNMAFEGRHHSGIDDVKNIVKIVQHLGLKDFVFESTNSLKR